MGAFEDNNRKYAEAFSRLREKGGLSLQEVSKRSGVALSTLSRTLQGETGTPMSTYEILVTEGLGATMRDFVDEITAPRHGKPKSLHIGIQPPLGCCLPKRTGAYSSLANGSGGR